MMPDGPVPHRRRLVTLQHPDAKSAPWWGEVTAYQWLVLLIASLGWVFDVFEGQIFVACMNEAMPGLMGPRAQPGDIDLAKNITLAAFLLGGAVGGVLFGLLGDRLGRTRVMVYTIVLYSAFTYLSAFSTHWEELALYRFLVGLGVGGEWAVASTLVAEVFPPRARPWSQSIFHASSVLGTYLAVLVTQLIVARPDVGFGLTLLGRHWDLFGWRLAFLTGVLPSLLIIWVRLSLHEPERWQEARAEGRQAMGRVGELFAASLWQRTAVGVGLATVGLATFWGCHIYGKDRFREARALQIAGAEQPDRKAMLAQHEPELKSAEMLGMFLVTTGGGLGLLSFGPLSQRLGRRGAFLFFQAGGLVSALVLFGLTFSVAALYVLLPVFGFLTLGMHAGFAVYFPELFPTRLRGTGTGWCFNVGRVTAAPVLVLTGWLQKHQHWSGDRTASALSWLFVGGIVLLAFAPETRGRDLPE
jgi:MFS family permease